MITLYSTLLSENIVLPYELIWEDEFTWVNRKAQMHYSIEGDLLIEPSFAKKGRPLTLQGSNALTDRQTILKLYTWANLENHEMILTLHDARAFTVLFRYWDTPIETSLPFEGYAKPDDNSKYLLILRLVEI